VGALAELEVEKISLVRGERLVLRELSFRVLAGETVALCGPNGAGKTSALRAIAGLLEVQSGSIVVRTADGQMIESVEERGTFVGWVGHQDGNKAQLTPREQLHFYLHYYCCEGDITEALACAGLSRVRDLPVQYLSAGQRRRLALARLALCPRPLWLLDEPLSVLDQEGKELVRQLIARHCDAGGLVVAATHEPLGVQSATLELA
jgi:heme exporter protein A